MENEESGWFTFSMLGSWRISHKSLARYCGIFNSKSMLILSDIVLSFVEWQKTFLRTHACNQQFIKILFSVEQCLIFKNVFGRSNN